MEAALWLQYAVTTDSSKFISSSSSSISSSADRNNRVNLSAILFVQKVLNHFIDLGHMECSEQSKEIHPSIVHNTGIKICSSIVICFQNFVQYWYTSNVIKILDCFILGGSCHQLLKNILKVQVHCVSFYWHL